MSRRPSNEAVAATRYHYLRDPAAIYRESFAQVAAATDSSALPPGVAAMAVRLVHACAMPDIVADLAWRDDPATHGRAALQRSAPIIVDCEMLAAGISRRGLPATHTVLCTLNDERVPELAQRLQTTRSAAAVELWLPRMEGAIIAIGNAPTALFRLLELLCDGAPKPAVILGFPVGYVGAAESKQALCDADVRVPYLTLLGRRGGSALAAAAVNSLALG